MADIVVKNVWKKYGDVAAVKGLSFGVKDGEILAILGPSGAGKTSTLKVIAGILPMDAGEVYIDGRLVNAVPTKHRDVAMIF
jgi:multiple sugar transport system ATP-binding protein